MTDKTQRSWDEPDWSEDDDDDLPYYADVEVALVAELAHIFAALRRGSRASRLRVTSLVCTFDHLLLQVFRGTDAALYAVYESVQRNPVGADIKRDRRASVARKLGGSDVEYLVRCRCSDQVRVSEGDILQAAEMGKRRLVIGADWG